MALLDSVFVIKLKIVTHGEKKLLTIPHMWTVFLRLGNWRNLPDKDRICSFCDDRHKKEREKLEEQKRQIMTKCKVCGQYCYLKKGRICLACFRKQQDPKIKEIREVRTDVY